MSGGAGAVLPVVVDDVRGHIHIGDLVFADTGPVLHVWGHASATLDVKTAYDLGQALIEWSFAKGHRP